jgi:hypothetical protein
MNNLNITIALLKYKIQYFFLILHSLFTVLTVATYHKLIPINEAPIAQEWVIYVVKELGIFTALVVVPCILLMYYLLVLHRYNGTWDIYHVRAIGVVFFLLCLYYIYIQNTVGYDHIKSLHSIETSVGETPQTKIIKKELPEGDDVYDEYYDESEID